MEFSTTLLREKFTLRDGNPESVPLIALSNRILIELTDSRDKIIEKFAVRAHTMHGCIRMAARILDTYQRVGPLMARDNPFKFDDAWKDIARDYEQQHNPRNWVAVYNGGKTVYSCGDHHAFLDVIENCDHKNTSGNYDKSVFLAEDIFASKGKNITIEHDANTGMVLDIKSNRARCGLVLRSPVRRTNFNYIADRARGAIKPLNMPHCLNVAAAFLEGIHLAFIIGRANEQIRLEAVPKYGEEQRRADSARKQLARLNAEIKSFETNHEVSYRPERPEFPSIVIEAEKFTRREWEAAQLERELEDGS